MPPPDRKDDLWLMVGKYSSLALMLPAATFTGYLVGYLLDGWLGTRFLRIVFLLLGIAGGFIQLIRELMKEK